MKQFRRWLLVVAMILGIVASAGAKKVHTLGDSTMAPYDPDKDTTRGWGMYFGNFLTNGWTSVNYAKGGRDSRGGYVELWQNAKNNVEAGDYVLIQFGHNDEKYNGADNLEILAYYTSDADKDFVAAVKSDGRGTTPSTTYKAWLKKIVDEVKAKGAIPVLVSPVCRDGWSGNSVSRSARHDLGDAYAKIGDAYYNDTKNGYQLEKKNTLPADDHTMDYTYHMKQLASEENVAFIDMTEATAALYEQYGPKDCYTTLFDKGEKVDHTHYNLTGALTAARLCAQLMKDAGILADDIVIPTEISVNPSTANMGDAYVGQSAMAELALSGLGLDPSSGTITISAPDGIDISFDKTTWQNELTTDYSNGSIVKSFYVRMVLTSAGTKTGTITVSNGTTNIEVPVTVNAIELGGGDPFTVTWDLNANDEYVIDGKAAASNVKLEGLVKNKNQNGNGILVAPTLDGAWQKAEDDSPNQYVQFTVTAPEGQKLDINQIAMKIGAWGGNGMMCHAYYSTDNFVTRQTIYAPSSMTNKEMNEVSVAPVISLAEDEQLQIRVYPWYTSGATGKCLCIQGVTVGGQSKDAAGVNIEGSITYALDKGGLNQDDDAVFSPETLTAGFAGKTWTAGSGLTVSGTYPYRKVKDDNTTIQATQTAIINNTTAKYASTPTEDNTLTLTLTPEDGFTFVPSKVSFEAARYGTNGGNINAVISAGENSNDICTNANVSRSDNGEDLTSFSGDVNGLMVTADNPLKLKFSFLSLDKTKSMGISNLVIEGTLVGAAAQTTKYVLTTAVTPEGAGTITLDPEVATYKEGKEVTLTAKKNFGYKFKEWQDASGTVVSTDAETTITMDADKTMTAVFEEIPVYTVTTKVANDAERELGSVTLSPNDHNGKYEAGTVITATANETKILKFTNWEDNTTSATRKITVNDNMTITANYEVQDFIAVFDASKNSGYASQGGYPFAADETWDANRNAKVSVVKQSDGTLVTGTNATPVVRNRANSGVLPTLSGVFQNGYNTAEIAWQYQFSTVDFTSATFEADMAAKNAATKNWKAQISTDGTTFEALGDAWEVTANTSKSLRFELPASAIGKETVYVRIMGTGTELLLDKYAFNAGTSAEGLAYATNSESQIGNVYVIGEAVVEADEEAPVVTGTIPDNDAENISASGKITISFDERIEAVDADAKAILSAGGRASEIAPTWSNRSVSFSYSNLDYNTHYSFTMPANFVQDKSGNKYAEAVTINFTTMDRPTVAKGEYDKVVSTTEELVAAINEANSRSDKSARYRIFVKKGTYKLPTGATKHFIHQNNEKTVIYWEGDLPDPITYITAPNISFIGEDRDATIITQDISNDESMFFAGANGATLHKYEEIGNSAVFQLEGTATDTYFQDITIKSGINDALGRNLAVHDMSSNTIYKNTLLYGYQDTWTSNNQNGLYYFEDGAVRGRTDYLCGKGDAFFQNLELRQIASGYAAVPSTPKSVGWVFKSCVINGEAGPEKYGQAETAADKVGGTYCLGRPWGKGTPVAVFIDTKMNVAPKAEGWTEMSDGWPARFAEWNSTNSAGAAIDLSNRKTTFSSTHANNPVLTQEEAESYADMNAMFGDWQPTLLTEQAPQVSNVEFDGSTISWTGNDYSFCYAVCQDGNIIDFTTETTYTVPSTAKALGGVTDATSPVYSVRAANNMGGLNEAVEATSTSGETTGINEIGAGENLGGKVASVEYYTTDGKQLASPVRGITIVRMRMADGSVQSKKLVK